MDAVGLAVFCVAGASTALDYGLGPVQAVILGTIAAIGGGIVRDVPLREVPSVLRQELDAIPAAPGAAVATGCDTASAPRLRAPAQDPAPPRAAGSTMPA